MRIAKEQWPQLIWLALLGALGVVLLLLGGIGEGGRKEPPAPAGQAVSQPAPGEGLSAFEEALERRLVSLLSQIEGAGEVEVRVALAGGPVYDYAVNVSTTDRQVEEAGESSGRRVSTEKGEEEQLVMRQVNGNQEPVVVKETRPQVQGVVVLAQGGYDPTVRAMISQAVQTLLGVAPHQVSVLPKR